jgi:uncharacterized protein YbjQ (UPF0145 family)
MSDASDGIEDEELPPDQAPAADLPVHARERLTEMRRKHFFTSDLSVNEFLLVKEAGFLPLGLVMGSSIYQIQPILDGGTGELTALSDALHAARDHAMTRMEEEAEALGADGVVAVRLEVNLHAWGRQIAEFIAIGTAVRHLGSDRYRNPDNKPFTSDLSGQDFWTLIRSGFRPVGFVMGNCVYYVEGTSLWSWTGAARNGEILDYTHALYEARELAMERLQDQASRLGASGIVGVRVEEKEHSWRMPRGRATDFPGEVIEFFVAGTAVVPVAQGEPVPRPRLVISAGK